MAVLDTANRIGGNGRSSTTTANGDKPKTRLWLNIGYEANGKKVTLPLGLPVDTMEPAKVSGQSEDWVKLRTAQNDLLKALIAKGAAMAPGEEQAVNLTIWMRRVNDELIVGEGDNEYAVDLAALLG
jgi:hypothetical protein